MFDSDQYHGWEKLHPHMTLRCNTYNDNSPIQDAQPEQMYFRQIVHRLQGCGDAPQGVAVPLTLLPNGITVP